MIAPRQILFMLALAGLPLSCKKTICNGIVTCGRFDLQKCATVPGCTPGPACNITASRPPPCGSATLQTDCAEPDCSWIAGACLPHCRSITTETACNAAQSAEKDQNGNPRWTCDWTQCLGVPEKSCSDYSVEMCPADLGCRVEDPSGFPDS